MCVCVCVLFATVILEERDKKDLISYSLYFHYLHIKNTSLLPSEKIMLNSFHGNIRMHSLLELMFAYIYYLLLSMYLI